MKNVITLAAVAGIASAAAAQSGSLSIVPSVSTIDSQVSTSFTLSVYGDADFGTAIAGGEFALSATGGGMVNGMTGAAAAWGAGFQNDRGHTGHGNHAGLVFGQLIFPPVLPPHADSLLAGGPVLLGVMTVSIDADSAGTINWSTAAGQGSFVLEIYNDADGSFTQLTATNAGTASVNVVPAPSAMALLGLGGLVAGRRRR